MPLNIVGITTHGVGMRILTLVYKDKGTSLAPTRTRLKTNMFNYE